MRINLLLGAAIVALVPLGCANPAAEAPQAEVSEPTTVAPDRYGAGTIAIDGSRSSIGFVGSKVTGSHDGGFRLFSGEIVLGEGVTDSSVRISIDTRSLWSDNERLTRHLQSEDFFDVARYPRAVFESTAIEEAEGGGFFITGNLTLHGVTKQVRFPAAIELDGSGVKASAEFAIKRFDFGIVYAGKADDLIRDDVLIRLELAAG